MFFFIHSYNPVTGTRYSTFEYDRLFTDYISNLFLILGDIIQCCDDFIYEEEIDRLKESLTSSFGQMSKEISKDMTGALTRVDEKVKVFNQQVEAINKSQDSFSRILAGVKHYGGLAEFSLAALLKDLLPAAQYIANVKMKPDENRDVVEFGVKLQNILFFCQFHD